ncbi:MAG: hypothetical protein FWD15_00085 [Alphaproteobacteria bacterium]|nr:hypothetical protein [Alphaproteobacteria bacterium]
MKKHSKIIATSAGVVLAIIICKKICESVKDFASDFGRGFDMFNRGCDFDSDKVSTELLERNAAAFDNIAVVNERSRPVPKTGIKGCRGGRSGNQKQ